MAHTYKTDPWHVKEARGETWRPSQFARDGSAYTYHRRDLSKRIRARERREMDRIMRDIEACDHECDKETISGNGAQFINVREVA